MGGSKGVGVSFGARYALNKHLQLHVKALLVHRVHVRQLLTHHIGARKTCDQVSRTLLSCTRDGDMSRVRAPLFGTLGMDKKGAILGEREGGILGRGGAGVRGMLTTHVFSFRGGVNPLPNLDPYKPAQRPTISTVILSNYNK